MQHAQRHFIFASRTLVVLIGVFSTAGAVAGSATVTLGPASVEVPAITPGLLIALGALIAVVALRVLLRSNSAQRILSLSLLGMGTLITALGIEKSDAGTTTSVQVVASESCQSSTIVLNYGENLFNPDVAVGNGCGRDLRIISYNFSCPSPSVFNDNGSPVGTLVPDEATVPLGYCEDEIDF